MILMSTVLYIKSKINLKQSFFRLTRPTTLLVSKVLPQITTNMDLKYFPVKSPDEGIIPPTAGGRATGTILKSCVMAISSGEFFPPGNSINAFHIAFNFQLLLRYLAIGLWVWMEYQLVYPSDGSRWKGRLFPEWDFFGGIVFAVSAVRRGFIRIELIWFI